MLCLGKRHAHLGPQAPLTGPLSPWSLTSSRVDSIMLVEEGFSVTSVDASDKMLKYALKERWNRRKEPAFDKWGTSGLSSHAPGACISRATLLSALALSCRVGWLVFLRAWCSSCDLPKKGGFDIRVGFQVPRAGLWHFWC